MIEKREQYEEWREAIEKFPNLRMWPKDMRAIVETIEALREVARAAKDYTRWHTSEIEKREAFAVLDDALEELPEWLLE